MTAPSGASDAAGFAEAGEQLPQDVFPARAAAAAAYGRVHAVPANDPSLAPSGGISEAAFRAFEIIVALIGLTIGLPVMIIEALLIRMDSPGPALFFQKRVGRAAMLRGCDIAERADLIPPPGGYRPQELYFVPAYFDFVKFRTMHSDAKQRFPELYAYAFNPKEFHGHTFKRENDPRVTRVGRTLRRLTIDELPNLWCVLIGTMRLVGPRPELPEIPRYYTAEEMYKFACKPGITGLAQINGRGLLNWGETLAWDLTYVRTRTVALDLKIVFLTLWYVIVRRGAF